jgi:hypothetical protein
VAIISCSNRSSSSIAALCCSRSNRARKVESRTDSTFQVNECRCGGGHCSRQATPLLVEDIWEAIEKIQRYVAGLDHDSFIRDDKTIGSVVRNLEIIGEAAKT